MERYKSGTIEKALEKLNQFSENALKFFFEAIVSVKVFKNCHISYLFTLHMAYVHFTLKTHSIYTIFM